MRRIIIIRYCFSYLRFWQYVRIESVRDGLDLNYPLKV